MKPATIGIWACIFWAAAAVAEPPSVLNLQGALRSQAGLAAPDGDYGLTIRLFDDTKEGTLLYKELFGAENVVPVKDGVFHVQLGSTTPLPPAIFVDNKSIWIEVQVGGEPALARRQLVSVPFSLVAQTSTNVACTGCIDDKHLAFEVAKKSELAPVAMSGKYSDLSGIPDLSPYAKSETLAKVATTGKYSDLSGGPDLGPYAKSETLAKVATTGKYSDLSGGPDLDPYAKSETLAKVATTGKYSDLKGSPDMAPYAKSEALAKVATTGKYSDLKGSPDMAPYAKSADLAPYARTDQSNTFSELQSFATDIKVTGQIYGLTAESAETPPKPCQETNQGQVYFDSTGSRLKVCANLKWQSIRMCVEDCPAPQTVECDQPVKSECGDDCKTTGKGLSTVQCATAVAATTCGQAVKDNCGNLCGSKGTKLDPTACSTPEKTACGAATVDPCGNVCGGKGTLCTTGTCINDNCQIYGSQTFPGKSCRDIVTQNPKAADGKYFIKTTSGTYKVYCDMTTDGGGWTMVMRMSKHDGSIDFTHDGAGWSKSSYRTVDAISLTSKTDGFDYISTAYGELGASNIAVRESLTSTTHSIFTNDGFLGGSSLRSVLSKPIVKGGQACSKGFVYVGATPKYPEYGDLVISGDENGDNEPARIGIRGGCGGDSETLQLGYKRASHGDHEVYSQGGHWPGLQSVYILVR